MEKALRLPPPRTAAFFGRARNTLWQHHTMATSTQSITVDQARQFILDYCPRVSALDNVPLLEAHGKVLGRPVRSPIQLPAYTNSAMDGYAFKYSDVAGRGDVTLSLVGSAFAGHPLRGRAHEPMTAARITTGAPIPSWCDTVIPYEKTTGTETTVSFSTASVKEGANVRRAGEDIQIGQVIVEAGTRIESSHIGLLASVGIDRVMVSNPLNVALICTGDELVDPGQPLIANHIYNASGLMLCSLLKRLGCNVSYAGTIADDPNRISMELRLSRERNQMIIITGGAADSSADYSQQQLRLLGEIFDWNINMRPGRPMRFGRIGQKPVFVLPGNPVATFVTFLEFVRGAILHMQGRTRGVWPSERRAIAGCDIRKKPGRAEFMRGVITRYERGSAVVEPICNQSSSSMRSLTNAEVLICLPHDGDLIKKGEVVRYQLLSELL